VSGKKINPTQTFDQVEPELQSSAAEPLEDLLPSGLDDYYHNGGQEAEPDEAESPPLRKEAEDYQQELEQWKDRCARLAAEMENYRKRSEREKFEAIKRANERLMKDMLPVLDNLERALENPGDVSRESPFYTGLDMITSEIYKIFNRYGLKAVEALGQPFDPNLHEAISQVVDNDSEENTVISQMQKGYTFEDRLLRAALVVVSKKS
jgi:molecular chaperone GrpE